MYQYLSAFCDNSSAEYPTVVNNDLSAKLNASRNAESLVAFAPDPAIEYAESSVVPAMLYLCDFPSAVPELFITEKLFDSKVKIYVFGAITPSANVILSLTSIRYPVVTPSLLIWIGATLSFCSAPVDAGKRLKLKKNTNSKQTALFIILMLMIPYTTLHKHRKKWCKADHV
jgi:hypothetical protein